MWERENIAWKIPNIVSFSHMQWKKWFSLLDNHKNNTYGNHWFSSRISFPCKEFNCTKCCTENVQYFAIMILIVKVKIVFQYSRQLMSVWLPNLFFNILHRLLHIPFLSTVLISALLTNLKYEFYFYSYETSNYFQEFLKQTCFWDQTLPFIWYSIRYNSCLLTKFTVSNVISEQISVYWLSLSTVSPSCM